MPIPDAPARIDMSGRLLGEAVFKRIAEAIVDGTLAQGEVLRDAELQRWLGVSRTPIREALSRLALLGLVETAPSRYTRVTTIDDGVIAETLAYTGYMAGLAVRMAVPRLTDDEMIDAQSIMDDIIGANLRDDHAALFTAASRLVGYMAARTGNRVFDGVMRETGILVQRTLRAERPVIGDRAERAEWYAKLRAAIAEGDGDYAEYAFRRQHHLIEPDVAIDRVEGILRTG